MPSENKTMNIGLNMWQGNEYPKRQDFVDDNIVIDKEIKDIKDAMENIEVPVKSVNNKTGAVTLTASDVGSVPTARKVNNKALSADITLTATDIGLGSVLNYGIATTAEAQTGAANNKYMTPATTKAAVLHLAATGGISMVKKSLRGVHVGGTGDITIPISSINPDKSFVVLDNALYGADYGRSKPILLSLTSTVLKVSSSTGGSSESASRFSWQVIEYY